MSAQNESKEQAAATTDATKEITSKVGAVDLNEKKEDEKPAETVQDTDSKNDDDDDSNMPITVDSLCMNCHENGTTRLLLLRVPFFRDIILESFECPHCNYKNNSVKAAGQIQPRGTKYTLQVTQPEDLERQIIKSDYGVFSIDTLGIEAPKGDGQLSNVQGMLMNIRDALSADQPVRKALDEEVWAKLEALIARLSAMVEGDEKELPFTISIDDPSGNSWIAPSPRDEGQRYKRTDYPRTREQNEELGLAADAGVTEGAAITVDADGNMVQTAGDPSDLDIVDGKVYTLPAECPGCAKACFVNMQQVHIPHFKEVFIWATVCDHCGYRSNEVKTGGSVPEKGKKITLTVESREDLNRDLLKSDTCAVESKDLDLSVQPGTLGGRFTTVEGLLTEVREQLHGQIFSDEDDHAPKEATESAANITPIHTLSAGDSMTTSDKELWDKFFAKLDSAISGQLKFTLVLEDPLANSYIQDIFEPAPDPRLKIEEYERTDEEEEELGLKDIKTEGYEGEEEAKRAAKEAEEEEKKKYEIKIEEKH
ncbi:zinc finger protein ZPR1 [Ascosphaera apis ARSEF 7405]|uniref:Zinc finger protein ZPR1 n=1 Tax=Ascosphaera apis ARSEF 7405 TaxID=392613 RepID=A0A166MXM0_9EURO|nr:zinc finger protein ZPR1 [Ascosphaera apis ARSEF 7405]